MANEQQWQNKKGHPLFLIEKFMGVLFFASSGVGRSFQKISNPSQKAYEQSEKRLASRKAYERSCKGRASRKAYRQSVKGKAASKAYEQSDNRRAARKAS